MYHDYVVLCIDHFSMIENHVVPHTHTHAQVVHNTIIIMSEI